ncbi:MAG: repeat protein, partial [Hyphomicrobiales bacterium]|nr:repeat protein [Hyphomicrobiales bacterium]
MSFPATSDYDSSLTSAVAPFETGAQAVLAAFPGGRPMLALSDGSVLMVDTGERVAAHPEGAILLAAADHRRIVTGGDDGRVVEVRPDGSTHELANEKGKWIDALALREDGATAWSVGKLVRARDPKGAIKEYQAPTGVRGLAFLPKGYRLAVSHYNGVSLWFPNIAAEPDMLKWAGSHLDVVTSPDGAFVVTAMQENALHGWRLADKKDMRMTGYPAKTRSFSFSSDGEWMATSGADACVVWPFQTKDGPMGKPPKECGVRPAKVSRVAFHPKAQVLAIGYEDGWILLT